jgi:hypothetical protein
MNQKIAMLQEQISLLVSNTASGVPATQQPAPVTPVSTSLPEHTSFAQSSNQEEPPRDPYARRDPKAPRHQQYMGPTSSAFSFGVARSSLQRMGIQPETDLVDDGPGSYLTTPARTPAPSNDWDPLLTITRTEAVRLIETYEEESGSIYSFLDIKLVSKSAHDFYNTADTLRESSIPRRSGYENTLSGGILDILKLVIAIALVIEGRGRSALSAKLLGNVESGFDGRLCGPSVDMLEIQAWTLMVCW